MSMFDNDKMAQYLIAGRKAGAKAVKEDADAPVKSGLQTLSEAFKKLDADKEVKADEKKAD
jgi:hypothetical protein